MTPVKRLGLSEINGGNDGRARDWPLSDARERDSFALAVISLTLDEIDATELLLRGRRRSSLRSARGPRWPAVPRTRRGHHSEAIVYPRPITHNTGQRIVASIVPIPGAGRALRDIRSPTAAADHLRN
jgi:hypothetical protein